MNTSVSIWDALFGEKLSIDLPQPDGTVKRVSVTKRWVDQMISQGKMKDVTSSRVKVNVLQPPALDEPQDPNELKDSIADVPLVKVEFWKIGGQLSKEVHDRYVDPKSNELYAMRSKQDNKSKTTLVDRALWEQARKTIENALASAVKVNILQQPPLPNDSANLDELMDAITDVPLVKVDFWDRAQVSKQLFDKFIDPQSNELYAISGQQDGQDETVLVDRALWEQTRKTMESR